MLSLEAKRGLPTAKIISTKHNKLITAGTETKPSKPSVRLTALAEPTITKFTKITYKNNGNTSVLK